MVSTTDESCVNGDISNRAKTYSTKDNYVEFKLPKKKKENIISYQRKVHKYTH